MMKLFLNSLILLFCFFQTTLSQSVEALTANFNSPQLDVRLAVIQELGALKTEEAFNALLAALPERGIIEREECALVLSQWPEPHRDKAMEVLLDFLFTDKARTVRRKAAFYLGQMASEDKRSNDKNRELYFDEVREIKENDGSQVTERNRKADERVKKIIKALSKSLKTDDSRTVRGKCIKGLAEIADKNTIKTIAIGLKDQYQTVRIEAILAFEKLKAAKHVGILIKHFKYEKYMMVREPLIKTIFKLDRDKAFKFLIGVVLGKKNQNAMRTYAAELLGTYAENKKYHAKAIKGLGQAYLKDNEDQTLRFQIIKSLLKYGGETPGVQPILKAALKDTKRIKRLAQQGLGLAW